MARNGGWPRAHSKKETEVLSLAACKELNVIYGYMSLEASSSQVKFSSEPTLNSKEYVEDRAEI